MGRLCCCVMFKPKYKNLVDAILHPKKDGRSSKNNCDKLIFHVTSRNGDFDKIGSYNLEKFSKYYKNKNFRSCVLCIGLFNDLIRTSGSECLTLYIMEMVEKSVKCTTDFEVNYQAIKMFFGYCRERSLNIYSYHNWKCLVDVFYEYCLKEDSNQNFKQSYKKCGLVGIYAMVHALSIQNAKKEMWEERLTQQILFSLMKNMNQTPKFDRINSKSYISHWRFDHCRSTFTISSMKMNDDLKNGDGALGIKPSIGCLDNGQEMSNPGTSFAGGKSSHNGDQCSQVADTNSTVSNKSKGIEGTSPVNTHMVDISEDCEPVNAQFKPWESKNEVLSHVIFKQLLSKLPPGVIITALMQIFKIIQELHQWKNQDFACYTFSTVCESIDESYHRTLIKVLLQYLNENRSNSQLVGQAVSLITFCIRFISMNVVVGVIGPEVVDSLLDLFVNSDSSEITVRENILNALSTFASHLQSSLMKEPMERVIARIPLSLQYFEDPAQLIEKCKEIKWDEKQRQTSLQILICLKAIVLSCSSSSSTLVYEKLVFCSNLQNGLMYPCERCREVLLHVMIHLLDQEKISKNLQQRINELNVTSGGQSSKLTASNNDCFSRSSLAEHDFSLFFTLMKASLLLHDNTKSHYRALALISGVLAHKIKIGRILIQLSRMLFRVQEDALKEYLNEKHSSDDSASCISRNNSLIDSEFSGVMPSLNCQELPSSEPPTRYAYITASVTASLLFISYTLAAQELVDICGKAIKKRLESGLSVMCPKEIMAKKEKHSTFSSVSREQSTKETGSATADSAVKDQTSMVESALFKSSTITFEDSDVASEKESNNDINPGSTPVSKNYLSRDFLVDPKSFLSSLRSLGFVDEFKTDRLTFTKESCPLFASSRNLNKSGESLDRQRMRERDLLSVTYYTLKDAASINAYADFDNEEAVSPLGSVSIDITHQNNQPNFNEAINLIEKTSKLQRDFEIEDLLEIDENSHPNESIYTF